MAFFKSVKERNWKVLVRISGGRLLTDNSSAITFDGCCSNWSLWSKKRWGDCRVKSFLRKLSSHVSLYDGTQLKLYVTFVVCTSSLFMLRYYFEILSSLRLSWADCAGRLAEGRVHKLTKMGSKFWLECPAVLRSLQLSFNVFLRKPLFLTCVTLGHVAINARRAAQPLSKQPIVIWEASL